MPLFFALFALNAQTIKADPSKSDEINTSSTTTRLSEQEVQAMMDRVYEIRDMDRSTLTKGERRELKKELIYIKDQLQMMEGVYIAISGLGIIILIILLIVLL